MAYAIYTRFKEKEHYFSDPVCDEIIQTGFSPDGLLFLCKLEGSNPEIEDKYLVTTKTDEEALALVKSWYPEVQEYFILVDGEIIDDRPMEDII